MTREDWLTKYIDDYGRELFKRAGHKLPKTRVSVGLPFGRGSKKAIGQHWHPKASDDGVSQVFISPTIVDGVEVLATLIHELVHACEPDAKHGKKFRLCAEAVGLTGQMKATVPGPELTAELEKNIKKIGKYPHAKLNLGMRPTKKQTTRMVKMECPVCEYKARAALTKILEVGPVICPCNNEPMQVTLPEET